MQKSKASPIFTTSLVDQVYEYLLDQIVSNKLSYGDNLNIKEISEKLGISTMPVREAIKRLEYDRVVEVKPRSSCQIRTPDKEEISKIYEVREGLEKMAVELFLSNFDKSKLHKLIEITKKMEAVNNIKDSKKRAQAAMELDYNFHFELCQLSENDYLIHYHRQLCLHLNMSAVHAKSYTSLKDAYFESHHKVLKSLQTQSIKAIKYLDEHFNNVWVFFK
jgi:GntR family transcriptional regulator, rspAB operon transcriptional repressor